MRNGTSTNSRRPRKPRTGRISRAGIPGRYPNGPAPAARPVGAIGTEGWQAVPMAETSNPSPELPLPPVESVRPGLWSIPVPIPNNPLRYVLVYAFETDRGPYLIDAGWNTDDAYQTLVAGLEQAGFAIDSVVGRAGDPHPSRPLRAGRPGPRSVRGVGRPPPRRRPPHPDPLHGAGGPAGAHGRHAAPGRGAPRGRGRLQQASMPIRAFVTAVTPDILMEDGDKPEVPGWDLTAIWTPGHSPGHLCFYEAGHRLMLSGDHVLPRITPNISAHPQSGPDPLGDFLGSLEKIEAYDVDEVLPAHEHRFVDLPARAATLGPIIRPAWRRPSPPSALAWTPPGGSPSG